MTDIIHTIFFDFGNVLVNWDVHRIFERFFPGPEAVDSFLTEVGYLEWNRRLDAGLPFAEGVAELSARFPQYAHAIRAYDTDWRKGVTGPISGTVSLLKRLKRAGIPLFILSNFSAEKFTLMRAEYDFVSLFDGVILSGEHRLVKPDPAFFRLALRYAGHPASKCLLVDDHLPNIESARALGLQAIHFKSPAQLKKELAARRILQPRNP